MGSKNNPGRFDCYANADADEPMFIFLGRDPDAAKIVRQWAYDRMDAIAAGKKPIAAISKAKEALICADALENWITSGKEAERRKRVEEAKKAKEDETNKRIKEVLMQPVVNPENKDSCVIPDYTCYTGASLMGKVLNT